MEPRITIDAVYVGTVRPLPPEGQPTGIFKRPVERAVHLGVLGFAGDEHGDRRVHGGVEKAVHYYPAEHYERFAAAAPALSSVLAPGVLGENLSGRGLVEATVCIGDISRVGTAIVQVSQPRRPCWRIDNRLNHPGANQLLSELGIPGWYYRVLQEGQVAPGDTLELQERPGDGLTLDRLLGIGQQLRPDIDEVRAFAVAPGLNPEWGRLLTRRAEWLERQEGLKGAS